jgi:uncharacterized damage-inducible protein DinB
VITPAYCQLYARYGRWNVNERIFAALADLFDGFAQLSAAREDADRRLVDWAGQLAQRWLDSTLEHRAASDGRLRRMPASIAATHLFNHAAHHRGQLTTLMKQAGVDPGVTDLPFMPGVVQPVD